MGPQSRPRSIYDVALKERQEDAPPPRPQSPILKKMKTELVCVKSSKAKINTTRQGH